MAKKIVRREGHQSLSFASPLLGRIMFSRGVRKAEDLDHSLKGLLAPDGFLGMKEAARILAKAIELESSILIVGDFDADGDALMVGSRKMSLSRHADPRRVRGGRMARRKRYRHLLIEICYL